MKISYSEMNKVLRQITKSNFGASDKLGARYPTPEKEMAKQVVIEKLNGSIKHQQRKELFDRILKG